MLEDQNFFTLIHGNASPQRRKLVLVIDNDPIRRIRIGIRWMPIRIRINVADPTRYGSATLFKAIYIHVYKIGLGKSAKCHICGKVRKLLKSENMRICYLRNLLRTAHL
jgi:hypothetical protein